MAATKFTYYLTPSEKLDTIEYKLGNLIFVEDLHRLYLDGKIGRVCYDSIVIFATDEERQEYENPFEGFYFVEETKLLWRYFDDEWTAITAPPSNSIVFIPKSDLPAEGETNVLYVCGTEMLIWDEISQDYVSMNAESVWHEV